MRVALLQSAFEHFDFGRESDLFCRHYNSYEFARKESASGCVHTSCRPS
jgi:hypothetical protein